MKEERLQPSLDKLIRYPASFREDIKNHFEASTDIANINQWLATFSELSDAVAAGRCSYRQVEDHVFELKCMAYLRSTAPGYSITYQPRGKVQDNPNCDISAFGPTPYLIELKCFHPEARQKAIPKSHLSRNNKLIMDPTTYHQYQAVRGRLVDVAHETEIKCQNYGPGFVRILGVFINFYLTSDHLEDFVALYRGRPRPDDPLAKMTEYNIGEPFLGTIDQFWGLPFQQTGFGFENNEKPKRL